MWNARAFGHGSGRTAGRARIAIETLTAIATGLQSPGRRTLKDRFPVVCWSHAHWMAVMSRLSRLPIWRHRGAQHGRSGTCGTELTVFTVTNEPPAG